MDALFLARLQFAVTTIYHFFFVPLSIGLVILIALMQTLCVRSGDEMWKKHTQFWGKLFLINFALGIVTGIVQEFQFGMNWSEYSRFVGDIFGAPLAIEALLTFFLESVFLGVWFFGWERLPKRVHLASIWLVAAGSILSAFWILIANSFMQEPVGYTLRNGRAEMTDFLALVTNPNIASQFPHVVFASMTTGAFFVLGISAWHLLRRSNLDFFRRSFQMATVYAVIAVSGVILVGHSQAQHMVQSQPMKMAAAEALYQTESPASFSILTIGDLTQRREVFAIRLPTLLSLLAFNQFSGEVKGINDLQAEYRNQFASKYGATADYIPPVAFVYWSFRAMVGAGFLMAFLALVGLYLVLRDRFATQTLFLRVLPWAILLPYLASTTGWMMTELGRQPWLVFGLMRTDEGVSPVVSGATILLSLALFTLIYGGLMIVGVYLMMKSAESNPLTEAAHVAAY
ncbi:MAG: cytochrome ubiquinol oxidase subunit I [Chloroflexota bacterium]|nr:cytochrome ubiquinol oxidase subunit I [Chloroflexota bacterium]